MARPRERERTRKAQPEDWRRYHCPVCGHSDRVTLSGDQASWIQCSHCDTLLEVLYQGIENEKVPVRVVLDREEDESAG